MHSLHVTLVYLKGLASYGTFIFLDDGMLTLMLCRYGIGKGRIWVGVLSREVAEHFYLLPTEISEFRGQQ
jgi:hypothetical protein